jgi:two-component system LytT family sensor kinase
MKKSAFKLLIIILVGTCFIQVAVAQKLPNPEFGATIAFNLAIPDSLRSLGYTNSRINIDDSRLGDISYQPNLLQNGTMKSPIMLGVKLNPSLTDYDLSPVSSYSKIYTAYRISDGSDAVMIALGISKDNEEDYRYRVVVNDSAEVVHWSKIPRMDQKYGAKKPYGFIGTFNYPDKQILVEVVNVKNYQLRDGIIFDWRRNFKPIVTNIRFKPLIPAAEVKKQLGSDRMNIQGAHQIRYDALTGAPTDIKFFADSVSDIIVIFKNHEAVAYNVNLYKIGNGKKTYISSAEGSQLGTEFKFNFINYPTGDYEIIISPQGSGGFELKDQQLHIPLKISPTIHGSSFDDSRFIVLGI